jgi:hypothetical protein
LPSLPALVRVSVRVSVLVSVLVLVLVKPRRPVPLAH